MKPALEVQVMGTRHEFSTDEVREIARRQRGIIWLIIFNSVIFLPVLLYVRIN